MTMDINDTANRIRYTATASQTAFAVPFEFFSDSDIKLYQNGTLKTLTTHYTLTGAGVEGGGTLTLVSGATLSDDILIVRDIPVERQGDFPGSGIFDVASLNTQLDKLTAMVRDLETRIDRRLLRLPVTDLPETLSDIPAKATRASKVLGFDADGQPTAVENGGTGDAALWGNITGTLASQTDLQSALDAKADDSHTHAISDITSLQATLDGKQASGSYAAASHSHAISDVTGLQTALDGKADTGSYQVSDALLDDIAALSDPNADRLLFWDDSAGELVWLTIGTNLTISGTTLNASGGGGGGAGDWGSIGGTLSDQTDLQSALDAKAASSHTHSISNVTNLQTTLDGKASSSHTHAQSDITSLVSDLAAKAPLASPTFTGTPAAPTASASVDTTQVATTAFVQAVARLVTENAQTGTTYTLALTDAGKMVTLSNASAISLEVPANATVAFPVNTRIDLAQYGAGQVTIAGAGGVTIRSSGSKLKLTGQYSAATLWKKATNEWLLIGDIAS